MARERDANAKHEDKDLARLVRQAGEEGKISDFDDLHSTEPVSAEGGGKMSRNSSVECGLEWPIHAKKVSLSLKGKSILSISNLP